MISSRSLAIISVAWRLSVSVPTTNSVIDDVTRIARNAWHIGSAIPGLALPLIAGRVSLHGIQQLLGVTSLILVALSTCRRSVGWLWSTDLPNVWQVRRWRIGSHVGRRVRSGVVDGRTVLVRSGTALCRCSGNIGRWYGDIVLRSGLSRKHRFKSGWLILLAGSLSCLKFVLCRRHFRHSGDTIRSGVTLVSAYALREICGHRFSGGGDQVYGLSRGLAILRERFILGDQRLKR